jgi:hypothetical protein
VADDSKGFSFSYFLIHGLCVGPSYCILQGLCEGPTQYKATKYQKQYIRTLKCMSTSTSGLGHGALIYSSKCALISTVGIGGISCV